MPDESFNIDKMDGYQFEVLIANIMRKGGYFNVIVTKKSSDHGKDIIMESQKGEIVIVECKHNKMVGRPVIQKLQGAMLHEQQKRLNRNIKGIVVTSGTFSNEAIKYTAEISQGIELIDGKKLKELCNELKIVILNQKVQILTDDCFKHLDHEESNNLTLKEYSTIYGYEKHRPNLITKLIFRPVCYVDYKVEFSTNTSIGCIDQYSRYGRYVIDGMNGQLLNKEVVDFFFEGELQTGEIGSQKANKIPYGFTQDEIESFIIKEAIEEHTHTVEYTANNKVTYQKKCVPKQREINVISLRPIYLPFRINKLVLLKEGYVQEFFNAGKFAYYITNDLCKCRICNEDFTEEEEKGICVECAKIVCGDCLIIDFWDNKTPICAPHTKKLKLFFESKFFATNKTRKEYKKYFLELSLFRKLCEDKIAFQLSIAGLGVIIIIIGLVLSAIL